MTDLLAVAILATIIGPFFVLMWWSHRDSKRRCPVCQDFIWPAAVNGRPDDSLCDRHYQIQWNEAFTLRD